MIQFILKNLWNRKGRYAWLVIELVIVTIICWKLFDPVIYNTYNEHIPAGFNMDRLYRIQLMSYPDISSRYHAEESTPENNAAHIRRLMNKLRNYPDIASATYLFKNLGPFSTSSWKNYSDVDSTEQSYMVMFFEPKSDFFKTFQFEEIDGQSNEKLDQMDFNHGVVMSSPAFPKTPTLGYTFDDEDDDGNPVTWKVLATIKRIKMYSEYQPFLVQIAPTTVEKESASQELLETINLNFRIREGVDENAFLQEFIPWAKKELRSGNLFVKDISSYHHLADRIADLTGVNNTRRVNSIICIFFLICLILGVSGTFWMQTKSRREEIGVLKSFGGTPSYITRILLGEGITLTTIATFIGCLLYLQYALKEGVTMDSYHADATGNLPIYWVNVFWKHFLGVSAIVWAILLVVVSIGIYIPARKISRIQAVDALRDE
ncbi:ABC transporter permease [uncultured Bacteroides sp.]|uniref:ABC transporter permease n=1 Tax=uncultured Bacteroides sp. TaxID=162156 RepID=UPI002627C266|nr:ABC transporter permease [uncultured Bacteroides sp.]